MKILIIDNGSRYINSLKALVSQHSVTVTKYTEVLPDDSLDYDLIILSGGHQFSVIGHEKKYECEINLVKSTNIPILGICLGFELIGHAYGATLTRHDKKEKDILKINKLNDHLVFHNLNDITVFESHRWVVTETGKSLLALADSKDGIEIVKHKTKLIYGFQFHPEMFPNKTQGDEIFANFMKIVQNRPV